jgi:hypothetical protein
MCRKSLSNTGHRENFSHGDQINILVSERYPERDPKGVMEATVKLGNCRPLAASNSRPTSFNPDTNLCTYPNSKKERKPDELWEKC